MARLLIFLLTCTLIMSLTTPLYSGIRTSYTENFGETDDDLEDLAGFKIINAEPLHTTKKKVHVLKRIKSDIIKSFQGATVSLGKINKRAINNAKDKFKNGSRVEKVISGAAVTASSVLYVTAASVGAKVTLPLQIQDIVGTAYEKGSNYVEKSSALKIAGNFFYLPTRPVNKLVHVATEIGNKIKDDGVVITTLNYSGKVLGAVPIVLQGGAPALSTKVGTNLTKQLLKTSHNLKQEAIILRDVTIQKAKKNIEKVLDPKIQKDLYYDRTPIKEPSVIELNDVQKLDKIEQKKLAKMDIKVVPGEPQATYLYEQIAKGQTTLTKNGKPLSKSDALDTLEKEGPQTLQIDKLPAKKGTSALAHLSTESKFNGLKDANVQLLVDTTQSHFSVAGSYNHPKGRLKLGRADANKTALDHEYGHFEFNKNIGSKYDSLQDQVQSGKSLIDILPSETVSQYGKGNLKKLNKLMKEGNTKVGANETMAVRAELKGLGFKKYTSSTSAKHTAKAKSYAAKHRLYELNEILDEGGTLTKEQSKVFKQAQKEINSYENYEIHNPVISGIAKISKVSAPVLGAGVVIFYHEELGIFFEQTKNGLKQISNPFKKAK